MYEMRSRVCYTGVDQDCRLQIPALLDCFQNTATFHSEDAGFGLQYLMEADTGWMVTNWQIEVRERPLIGEEILARTHVYDAKPFMVCRWFELLGTDGRLLALANSLWIYMNKGSGKPARVPEGVYERYQVEAAPSLDPFLLDRKEARLPEGAESRILGTAVVPPDYIDSNGHMNNVNYLRLARAFAPDVKGLFCAPSRIKINYKKQAMLGECLTIRQDCTNRADIVRLCTEDGEDYCVISAWQMECEGEENV